MNNQRYYPCPYWTMNSSEAGASFLLVCFILAIPALPAGMFGWFIGEHMIGNNFAKLGLMILFFGLMYFFVLYIGNTKGLWYAIFVVFLEYFIWDYSSMIYHEKDALVMQKLIHALLEWGLHMQ